MTWRGYLCAALDGGVADVADWHRRAAEAAAARLAADPAAAPAGTGADDDPSAVALRDLETERQLQRLVLSGGLTLRPGAAAFLVACAERGPVGIVSGLPRPVSEGVLAGAGLADHVAFLWCGGEGGSAPWRRAALRPVSGARRRVALVGDAGAARDAARAGFSVIVVGSATEEALPARAVRWRDYLGRSPDDLSSLPSWSPP